MAVSSSKGRSNCYIRSISLPSRSHPTTLRILDSTNKLRSSWDEASTSSSRSVSAGLSSLEGVSICMDDFLNTRSTQQTLSCNVCDYTRQTLLRLKEQVRALQSALRQRKCKPGIEMGVAEYTNFRKRMKKDTKGLVAVLRKMTTKFEDCQLGVYKRPKTYLDHLESDRAKPESVVPKGTSPVPSSMGGSTRLPELDRVGTAYLDHAHPYCQLENEDHHLSSAIRVVRDGNMLSTSIFQFLLSFLAMSMSRPNKQLSRWSIVSKLVNPKGALSCDQGEKQEDVNELECVDRALTTMCKHMSREGIDSEKLQVTQCKLEHLEIGIGRIEDALEGLSKCLIRIRASLLNILSWWRKLFQLPNFVP
ncbi:hypothetical protein BT93_L1965 [Corymbia citriodora subsp. variegata]|uniref:Uncharacterized protein n=1 Tax=Corymbia citriodora subsp. variegata TaxID=360336 RepID=A0A8T0CKZ6_CORYI|nr:hypothetical protein BT93_L1965 [Corymbia citriodora subsp. variegata]